MIFFGGLFSRVSLYDRPTRAIAGFSLLELLLVIAILAVLGSIGGGYYFGVVQSIELDTVGGGIVSDLNYAQSSTMGGEYGVRWGVHFVNGSDDYYQVFATPTNYASASTTIVSVVYLPQQIFFTDPAEGVSKDVVFERISGSVASTTISIASPNDNRVITIPSLGGAY